MGKYEKFRAKLLSGLSDQNIAFTERITYLRALGFAMRISGSHHIFRRADVEERLNLQRDGKLAKAYQIRQVRNIILKHRIGAINE
jgi:predicted RNA binding protein YcfA (HicA-like mRNA interferase family)